MRTVQLVIAGLVLAACLYTTQTIDRAEIQLQAAINKETIDGDLKGAIAQYQKILTTRGVSRAVAAKALLHLGQCHEKLGSAEARKAYERLVMEFADQAEPARAARERLAVLLKSAAEVAKEQASRPVFRKITIPGKINEGAQLSPDGSSLAFVSSGDIWLVSLRGKVAPDIAGQPMRLTQSAGAAWGGLAWSRNGEWIAFNHVTQGSPPRDIYVVSVSGGAPRKLPIEVSPRGGSPTKAAKSFSADGSHIAYSKEFQGELALHMVSVATGDDVSRLADPVSIDPAFSPDGKFIAYIKSWEVQPYDPRNEVRILRLADRGDVRFTEIPSRARSPVWSPDGKFLAFLILPGKDDRSQELWVVPVLENGTAATAPTKIGLPNATHNSLAGWTTDDKIGILFDSPFHNAIYTVPVAGGKATQVTPEGDGFTPQWSPDGQRIYFWYGFGETAFVPAGGGQVNVIPRSGQRIVGQRIVEALPGGGNHVSPDGKRIVFSGAQEGVPGIHLWTMPVTGGEAVRLPMKGDLTPFQPRWSPDGQWIAFEAEKYNVPEDRSMDENIYVVSSQGGEPRQLTNHTDCFCELEAWSPDGNLIAYACKDGRIRIIPFKGGEPRVVVKVDGLESLQGSLAWTPDGVRLLYTAKGRIWTISVAGGEPTAITTDLDGKILQFALSPDGQRIAFNAPSGEEPELWLMEDFLSLVKTGTRR